MLLQRGKKTTFIIFFIKTFLRVDISLFKNLMRKDVFNLQFFRLLSFLQQNELAYEKIKLYSHPFSYKFTEGLLLGETVK